MSWPAPDASQFLRLSFTIFGLTLAGVVLTATIYASRAHGETRERSRRLGLLLGTAIAAWLGGTWVAADAGGLARSGDGVPGFMILIPTMVALACAIAFSRVGTLLATGLPMAALVGFHGYRVPLELLMHRAWEEGVMPVQMSYAGRNWDIVTGVTAIALAVAVARGWAGRPAVWAWNVLGLGLLVNISVVAMRSTPIFAAYGPERLNTWVAYPPFVWLPAVMVLLALAGHLVVFRALLKSSL